jgi:hypothetical protein
LSRVLFCADPLNARHPDESYRREAIAATDAGFGVDLIRIERLVDDADANGAIRSVRLAQGNETAFYRGWMLSPAQYSSLYSSLRARDITLVNTPEQYRHCHYLPHWYSTLEGQTPRSIWLHASELHEPGRLAAALAPFEASPLIVKDYVKSRKHDWAEACFIPAANDFAAVERVVHRFIELQGDALAEGLVFREFVALRSAGSHPKSGMPLAQEYRLFFLDGRCLTVAEYWESTEYGGAELVPIDHFTALASRIASRFFTMDVALTHDGRWIVVELGDGQVAELPARVDAALFYRNLVQRADGAHDT